MEGPGSSSCRSSDLKGLVLLIHVLSEGVHWSGPSWGLVTLNAVLFERAFGPLLRKIDSRIKE